MSSGTSSILEVVPIRRHKRFFNSIHTICIISNLFIFSVGAGSAGSVIAARLSEDPCVSVLLLEAGGPADPISEVPAAAFLLQNGYMDWGYKTVPQKRGADGYENSVSINHSLIWFKGAGILNF